MISETALTYFEATDLVRRYFSPAVQGVAHLVLRDVYLAADKEQRERETYDRDEGRV
jgi:hypothetical protein